MRNNPLNRCRNAGETGRPFCKHVKKVYVLRDRPISHILRGKHCQFRFPPIELGTTNRLIAIKIMGILRPDRQKIRITITKV